MKMNKEDKVSKEYKLSITRNRRYLNKKTMFTTRSFIVNLWEIDGKPVSMMKMGVPRKITENNVIHVVAPNIKIDE